MVFIQITYLCLFIYWILLYSYSFITPSLLLSNEYFIKQLKILSQSFASLLLDKAFDAKLYIANTMENIKESINQNPNLIDIIICNHVSTIDFIIMMAYFQHFNINSYNFVLKNEITFVPGIGLVMYASSDIKLNRNWDKDKHIISKQLDNINTTNKQIILIFPEGTRLTQTKLIEAQNYSKNNSIPVYQNMLVPKTKGLWSIINHLKNINKLGNIWDSTLIIPKFIGKSVYISDIIGQSLGNVYCVFKKINIPNDLNIDYFDDFKLWFIDYWKQKDELFNNFNKLIYNKINLNEQTDKHFNIILLLCLFLSSLLFYKNTRYYLFLSFIVSYYLIYIKKY